VKRQLPITTEATRVYAGGFSALRPLLVNFETASEYGRLLTMRKSRAVKIMFALLLVITAFHFSGMEMAFCNEGPVSAKAESHGCMSCQPTHHSATMQQTVISISEFPVTFVQPQSSFFKLQAPHRSILRPPIAS